MPFSQDPRKGYNVFMAKENINRSGCKDVFHAFLVKNASYDGNLEMPCIKAEDAVPQNVITFSKAVRSKEYDNFVHFYEDDVNFERIWNNPNRYLPILKKFDGVISPDFSLYRDMPLVMQQWNTYRSRAIGHWLQTNGITVIPNIRFADERSFAFCCDGISRGRAPCIHQGLEFFLLQAHLQSPHRFQSANGAAVAKRQLGDFSLLAKMGIDAVFFNRNMEHLACTCTVDVFSLCKYIHEGYFTSFGKSII